MKKLLGPACFAALLALALPTLLSLAGLSWAKVFSVYLLFHIPARLGQPGGTFFALLAPAAAALLCVRLGMYLDDTFGRAGR